MSVKIELLGGPNDGEVVEVGAQSGVYYMLPKQSSLQTRAVGDVIDTSLLVNAYRRDSSLPIRNGRVVYVFAGVEQR